MEEKNVMTDEQLAIGYMAGDNKAFDELLRRYKNKVFSSVYNMINDRLAAEDVFQDIFIRIIVGLGKTATPARDISSSGLPR